MRDRSDGAGGGCRRASACSQTEFQVSFVYVSGPGAEGGGGRVQGQERRASAPAAPGARHQGPGARRPVLAGYSPAWRRRSCSSMYRAASSSVSSKLMSRPRAIRARSLSRRDWATRHSTRSRGRRRRRPMREQRASHVTAATDQ